MDKYLFSLCILSLSHLWAQVGVGTNTPHSSSMLEVQSTDKGILFPRMTSTQRMAIGSPANGLHVFDTNTNSLWYYNGSFWVNSKAEASEGDVKSGIQTADHSGWVLLDGRALSTLSANQQAVAASLGITGNLPNATNAYLVQNGGSMGAVSGSNTTTLTQANLPNVSFTGTASNAGGHSHTTDPAAVTSSSGGSHSHTVDPASVNTSTNGNHTHSIGRRLNQDNGAYDPGDGRAYENSAATTDRTFNNWFNVSANGDHAHSVDIPSTTTSAVSDHSHTVDIPSTTSSSVADHTHPVSVSSGGSASPINIAPKSLSVNMFIYLGL